MFSSKSNRGKWTWALVDLLVVIIGVYIAFLIQSSESDRKQLKEKEEIITALKYELEFFRIQMPGQAWYSKNKANEWTKIHDAGNYSNYSSWRFIEPQYNYQVTEHALNISNAEIISFELSQALRPVYVQIRRIEQTERTLTEMAGRYQSIPGSLKKGQPEYDVIWNKNYDNYKRFVQAMLDRASNQELLGNESISALKIINEQISKTTKRKVEESLTVRFIDELVDSEEEAVVVINRTFPDFTEDEARQMYQRAIQEESNTN